MLVPLLFVAFGLTLAIGALGGGSRGNGPVQAGRGGPPKVEGNFVVFPAGTEIPFRLLRGIVSGRDRAGSTVYGQTLAALTQDTCVVAPPYLALRGRITESRGGGWFGRRAELTIRFDSLEVNRGVLAPVDAEVDSFEYVAPGTFSDSGRIYGGRPHAGRIAAAGLAEKSLAITGLTIIPVAALDGFMLFRRTAPVRLVAGEVGRLRLLAPLAVPEPPDCRHVAEHPDLTLPPLPEFVPRTTNRAGTGIGDPINFVFLGTLGAVDTAFLRAGWSRAHPHTTGAVAKEVEQALRGRPAAIDAPVSTEYFEGRPEDAAYELQGPTARARHHIRVWKLDGAAGVVVGAANEDIGLLIDPLRGRATHRVNPDIDRERDYIVTQLEAGGCADLLGFVRLPGAPTEAKGITGQKLATDGRAATVRTHPGCGG